MAIPAVTFLRSAALLPVLVPLCAIALELLLYPAGAKLPNWIEERLGLSLAAVLYFGVPYAVLMGSLRWVVRRASLAAQVWAAVSAPILMALVAIPAFLWAVGIRGAELRESWRLYAELCLEVGFTYVACALAILILGLKAGLFRRAV